MLPVAGVLAAAVVAVVVFAAGGACGCGPRSASTRLVVTVPPARKRPGTSTGTGTSTGAAGPATTTTTPSTRTPALRHLQAMISGALAREGANVGVLVEDLGDGEILYTRNAEVARPPASVEKLYTSVALIDLLGPAARLHTDILGTGHLGAGGVWHGNLYLRGDGDPTFGDGTFNRYYEGGYGPTAAELAAQLRTAGIRRITGRLYADASRFRTGPGGPATGGAPDIPDYGGELSALVYDHGMAGATRSPALFAAHEMALTLRLGHIQVQAAGRTARTPTGARVLAAGVSPTLPVLLRLMDVPSDDLFADLLTMQIGYHLSGQGTLRAGAAEVRRALASRYGLVPVIFDGSGLDRDDRSSPEQIVSLLRAVWKGETGRLLAAALPVVGRQGTVIGVGLHTAAVGRCVAKTGTLNNVSNLAGVCAARGGHELAFALMIDGPENWQAFTALGQMVGAIAAY